MPSLTPRSSCLFVASSWLLMSVTMAPRAFAEDVVEVCASASERAQAQRDEGALLAARSELIACAADRCPGVVKQDCVSWLAEVEAALPTVVVTVRDADGRDVAAAGIEVDGVLREDARLGRAFAVDPGPRRIAVRVSSTEVDERIVVREGEKGRAVTLTIPGAEPDALTVPVGAWVLAGVGVIGIGLFAGFAATVDADVDDMRATCAPNCSRDRVDEAQTLLLAGNISFGVGLAALGAAVAWTFVAAFTSAEPGPVSITPSGVSVRF